KPAPAAWWKRRAVLAGAGAAVVLAIALAILSASGVLRVKTKDGVIVLENLPPDAEVMVDGDRATLTLVGGRSVEVGVTAGKKHRLQVKKDGLRIFGDDMGIDAGDRRAITVRLEPAGAAGGATGDGLTAYGPFVSLFDGKGIDQWELESGDASGWQV